MKHLEYNWISNINYYFIMYGLEPSDRASRGLDSFCPWSGFAKGFARCLFRGLSGEDALGRRHVEEGIVEKVFGGGNP